MTNNSTCPFCGSESKHVPREEYYIKASFKCYTRIGTNGDVDQGELCRIKQINNTAAGR